MFSVDLVDFTAAPSRCRQRTRPCCCRTDAVSRTANCNTDHDHDDWTRVGAATVNTERPTRLDLPRAVFTTLAT